jgi:septal ring factor EnvC (AmiA/AmiB activator)
LTELSAKARDVQMLKFGKLVDLEKLEKLGSNKIADELRERIRLEDNQRQKDLQEMEEKLKQERLELMNATKFHTECMEKMLELKKKRKSLENSLNSIELSAVCTSLSRVQNSLGHPLRRFKTERACFAWFKSKQNIWRI